MNSELLAHGIANSWSGDEHRFPWIVLAVCVVIAIIGTARASK